MLHEEVQKDVFARMQSMDASTLFSSRAPTASCFATSMDRGSEPVGDLRDAR